MSLPAPSLDDRTFQQLVDEAKRYVQRRCPTWTNHNVSDPGVTLIETFAWMTDMLIYRLNRVPERNHLRFLELLGVSPFPPSAARTVQTFRLSSHQPDVVRIPLGTSISTRRTATDPAIGFTTATELLVQPAQSRVVLSAAGGQLVDRSSSVGLRGFACFAERPGAGDAIYIGLDRPAPSNILLMQFVCEVGGHGIDPRRPPLRWEAWNGVDWEPCPVELDGTLGLNKSGAVEIHLPDRHVPSTVGEISAAWVRCVVVEDRRLPAYRSSPVIVSVTAATVGGSVAVVHAERIDEELLGVSDGTSGQVFQIRRPPVLSIDGRPLVLDVGLPARTAAGTGPDAVMPGARAVDADAGQESVSSTPDSVAQWQPWTQVPAFADSAPDARHFTVDATSGEVRFGPMVRLPDGSVRRYGAVPPKGALLRLRAYRTGGGDEGNVSARSLCMLRSSIPYVASVYNRAAASGGVDGETVAEAAVRGPLELRSRNRAVTAEDYEELTRQAAPEFTRVRCVPATGQDAGAVRVLVVPTAPVQDGRIALRSLRPDDRAVRRVADTLDRCRMIGARVSIEPPSYVGVRVDARIRAKSDVDPERLERDALTALYGYFNPLTGGPRGDGWPFGRPVQVGEVYAVLARVGGIDFVEEAVLFQANPVTGQLSEPRERLELEATHLAFSFEHQVLVEASAGAG